MIMKDIKWEDIEEKRQNLRMTKKELATILGVDEKTLYNWKKGKVIPKTKYVFIESFLNTENYNKTGIIPNENVNDGGNPYYDVDFMGGIIESFNDQTINPSGYINLPQFNDNDVFWCNLTGHSMEPMIGHGDIIALKQIHDWRTYLPKGEVYALVLNNNMRTVKIVRKGSDSEHILLVPVNKEYDPEEIAVSSILRIFTVVGTFRRF